MVWAFRYRQAPSSRSQSNDSSDLLAFLVHLCYLACTCLACNWIQARYLKLRRCSGTCLSTTQTLAAVRIRSHLHELHNITLALQTGASSQQPYYPLGIVMPENWHAHALLDGAACLCQRVYIHFFDLLVIQPDPFPSRPASLWISLFTE